MAYDIVIRNGTLVDGSGRPPVRGDLAISGARIAAVGEVDGRGARTIDAEGQLVTPGFVDIHTHLDAQLSWDPLATSPCWHGVTSVVMGNCGVGFAPCRPADRDYLARLMESVEDIPAASIREGLRWNWVTYGDFLDALETLPKGVNAGGLIGHCSVRLWAMGERAVSQHEAGPDDIARMREIVAEGLSRGALGFSTSRTRLHRTPDGDPVPGTFAGVEELMAIARVMQEQGRGVFEAVPYLESEDPEVHLSELRWMTDLCLETGRPLTFGYIHTRALPEMWKTMLGKVAEANARGARLRPQTQVRSVGILFGLCNMTPWDLAGGAWGLLKLGPFEQRLAALRNPEARRRLLEDAPKSVLPRQIYDHIYLLPIVNGEPDYRLLPENNLNAIAARRGVGAAEAFIDLSLESQGRALFLFPLANDDFEVVGRLLRDPHMLLGLADSGAHCGQIQDASLPSFLLGYWVRDHRLFPVEEAIRKLTSEPAEFFGLRDRGVLREGAWADVNVIDLDGIRIRPPEYVQDFPAGASRYVQRAEGYSHTLVNGRPFMEKGEHTGELAGMVLR
jgi:N-acyl-D-aspartate/D-glutamate deacylase